MRHFLPVSLAMCACLISAPVFADDVTDNVNDALAAYEAGDMQEAKEILEYAVLLLSEKRTDSLSDLLPAPLPGWTVEEADNSEMAAAMGMAGGGAMAEATYYREADEAQINFQLVADSPMVAVLAPQIANPAIAAQMGEIRRINRQRVLMTDEGGLQAIVSSRFLIQIEGDADPEDMIAYFEAIDLDVLGDF